MKRTAPAAILLATGLIAGCSTSEPLSQKANFESVVPAKAADAGLEVPPDLTAPQTQDKYSLPGASSASASQMAKESASAPAVTPAANNGDVAVNVDQVKMMRAGSQRWLDVGNKTPTQLWPMLKAFWQDSGFTIKTEEPNIGIMETDWAENRAKLPNDGLRALLDKVGLGGVYSTSERDMFRIRLEKGENGGTEVYFSHRGLEEVYTDKDKTQTIWQPRPVDPELEAEMLGRFMMRLGMSEEQAKTVLKQTIVPTATQANPIANGTLTIGDTFDRTWRRVGLALDRIGLVVDDRDRSQGIYYVKPAKADLDQKQESGGFWSSLAFWRSSTPQATAIDDSGLQIRVKETTPGNTAVSITDKQGRILSDGAAKSALQKLQSELQ
ncbi:MAG: outer membrane protein assembly factor BamC [Paludibacterium sp.]|uniref:outer membrane protein assembly factor BamC n=1 Tax=Paludibacterium sp. TaxID=1917523 RepID=UPI0025F5858F|nr:outer membrane protein assembly factor BamC [Paludibacterium sp.]MBV8046110.1 outer membrane protein assembly factor BamC [Paludibacterium sp.]MBV8648573.1 outer membrane protein assembly factor BamC [Paludibacterium sp.]